MAPHRMNQTVQTAKAQWLAVCVLLALAVWAVFGQTLRYGFVDYDDHLYVYDNPVVQKGLTWDGIGWSFTHTVAGNWHPLTIMSFMLDAGFCGGRPAGYHLTNVILHTVAVILLFLAIKAMTGALWRSAFVAAVFAIHPLRVESVAWVAERKDVLSGVFFALTLWAYVRYVQKSTVPAAASTFQRFTLHASRFYWLAVVCFALGLMSKPMLVTLPFVLLLLDYWPLNRSAKCEVRSAEFPSPHPDPLPSHPMGAERGKRASRQDASVRIRRFSTTSLRGRASTWNRLLVEKIPFFVLSAAACVATLVAQQSIIVASPLSLRISNALVTCVTYLGQMFWPGALAVLYPFPKDGLPLGPVAGAGLLLALISAGVFLLRGRRPWLLVGWLWYLGMLIPVIGLVQVGQQAHADRYTYLPQIGLYVALVWGAVDLCGGGRWQRVGLGLTAGAALAGLMVAACAQTRYWKDSVSLWTHTLAIAPANETAHNNLGLALAEQGQLAEAIQHYQRALQLKPDYAAAHNNLAVALVSQGKLAEAIAHYQRALQLNPDYAEAHNNLGFALATEGMTGEAISHYQRALELKPDYADAHMNLGVALAGLGNPEAIREYERAIQLKPDYAEAYENLGIALAERKQTAEAVQYFERAIQLKPDFADAHYSLGLTLTAQGRWPEAIQQLARAVQLKPDYAVAHLNLGAVLAHEGKTAEALPQFQQALDLATAQSNSLLADAARARLRKYQPAPPSAQGP
jgi:tetratricopeptide (TPR) repeat protein